MFEKISSLFSGIFISNSLTISRYERLDWGFTTWGEV